MLAPNGEVSHLTERQYAQVRTKEFKNWFGDWENDPKNASKVVDENGEPLVVYHGAPYGGFSSFDNSTVQSTIGGGNKISHSFFTSDLNAALRYSETYIRLDNSKNGIKNDYTTPNSLF